MLKYPSTVFRSKQTLLADQVICGIWLRAIRELSFGRRNPNGGRPRLCDRVGGFSSWNELLKQEIGMGRKTAGRWMLIVSAVEQLAEREGINLRETTQKPPSEWTPEEALFVDSTVKNLTWRKTSGQLLKSIHPPSKPN